MKTILMCYEEGPVASRVVERTAFLGQDVLGAKVLVTSVAPVLHGRGGPIDASILRPVMRTRRRKRSLGSPSSA